MEMKECVISVTNLSKIYKNEKKGQEFVALDNVSFDIQKGEVVGLLGHNGAGKSTFINILCTLMKPTFGSIDVFGKDNFLNTIETKSILGVVPQDISLDVFFTVREYLELFSLFYGKTKNKDRVDSLLDVFGLKLKENSKTSRLSGGMKRRLMMAKALIADPEIVVLDEPTAGVDFNFKSKMLDYVMQLKKRNKTTLLTTHNLDEVDSVCDRVLILNHGKIIYNATIGELKRDHSSVKVKFVLEKEIKPELLSEDFKKKMVEITENFIIADDNSECINFIINFLSSNKIKIKSIFSFSTSLEDAIKKIIAGSYDSNISS